MPNLVELESAMPVAPLKLLALDSCKELGERVNEYLVDFRKNVHNDIKQDPAFRGYSEENYLIKAACLFFFIQNTDRHIIPDKRLFLFIAKASSCLTFI